LIDGGKISPSTGGRNSLPQARGRGRSSLKEEEHLSGKESQEGEKGKREENHSRGAQKPLEEKGEGTGGTQKKREGVGIFYRKEKWGKIGE